MNRRMGGAGMRRALRGGARRRAVAPLLGLTGFSSTSYAGTTNPGGIAGTDAGFWVALLFTVESQDISTATRVLASRFVAAGGGWRFATTTTHSTLLFQCINASSGQSSSNAYTIQASDVGKVMMAVGIHTGANQLRLVINRAEVGSATGISGFTPTSAAMLLGKQASGSAASDTTIYGLAGGHGVPTLEQAQAYFDAVKSARRMVAMDGVATDGAWPVEALATVEDQEASDDLNLQGAGLSLVTASNPTWGW